MHALIVFATKICWVEITCHLGWPFGVLHETLTSYPAKSDGKKSGHYLISALTHAKLGELKKVELKPLTYDNHFRPTAAEIRSTSFFLCPCISVP